MSKSVLLQSDKVEEKNKNKKYTIVGSYLKIKVTNSYSCLIGWVVLVF